MSKKVLGREADPVLRYQEGFLAGLAGFLLTASSLQISPRPRPSPQSSLFLNPLTLSAFHSSFPPVHTDTHTKTVQHCPISLIYRPQFFPKWLIPIITLPL